MSRLPLRGKAWVCGDFVDAFKILPQAYWGGAKIGCLSEQELGKHAMEGVAPNFYSDVQAGKYHFIVAGRNFGGGGKSIEHPIFALKGAGVKAVIAESASRYFFRNSINNGLLVMICDEITRQVKVGDELELNVIGGEILNVTTGARLRSAPLPEVALEILEIGGYLLYTKKKLAEEKA
jgi:3-isopropylmalate/(R)-2-methylmalate dehydratase small subunit